MTAVVLRGDARRLPLPDASVDLICCSPPYFGLRSYSDGGVHYEDQIGSEATPAEWLAALLDCTRDWIRVLKPSGSIFVNLGDKYSGNETGGRLEPSGSTLESPARMPQQQERRTPYRSGMRPKSLMGLPWRYALACMDELGLILRRDIIWCLSGGARVYARTRTGDRPLMLRDLVRAYRPEDVQLWNGERWTQVLGWNRSPDRDGALELELRTGERIGCTPGHRWPTQRGVIRADEIRIGDVIATARLPEPDAPATPRALPLEDIGWLVGLYMAEGSRSEKTLQFAGHVREDARHERLSRIAEMYHGSAAVYQTSENGVTCNISGAVLLGIIDHYIGRGTALTKRLRKAVWQRGDVFLRSLAEGYLSGDGHYDAKNDRWRLGFTANDEWAADLRTLAARLGAKISLRRTVHQMGDRRFPGWRGEWRWSRSAHHNAKRDGEVIAIRASRAREFYDVGVDGEPHLFALASGVLTHNSKPNGLPESVTDRCRSSHEYLFHFTVRPRYYAAVDEIREPHIYGTPNSPGRIKSPYGQGFSRRAPETDYRVERDHHSANPLGKLPGSVWEIPSQPLSVPACRLVWGGRTVRWFRTWEDGWRHMRGLARDVHGFGAWGRPSLRSEADHFASFPMELPRRVILGWSPPGVCTECGEGRRPVADETGRVPAGSQHSIKIAGGNHIGATRVRQGDGATTLRTAATRAITGYACACPDAAAPVRPAVVVDPFGGTGTTALVASMLGRTGVSVDLSMDYARLAKWRTSDPGERARALGVSKPPKQVDGQGDLFSIEEATA